ncbi:MAG: cytochrome c maturation protein CcmE [Methanomicrobiales archaeon]|nr:cytochrome c maturation protein CcmE [Methanomicrobiales archaeon]
MNIKLTHVMAIILLVVAGVLAYDALTSSINPYLTVSQAAVYPGDVEKEVQILATLSSWSFDDRGAMYLDITDGNSSMEVYYTGVPPQSLQKGQKIVAIGLLDSDHSMNATRILTKCPSKYE